VLLPLTTERAGLSMDRTAGIFDGVNRAASLLGAPLAGVLISVLGASAVLTVDAMTFGLAFVIIALTAPRHPNSKAGTRDDTDNSEASDNGSYGSQLAAGMKFLLGNRLLLAIAVMLFFTNLMDQAFGGVLLPVWALDSGEGAVGLGLVAGAFGVGATLGSTAMAAWGPRLPRRLTFFLAFLIAGAPRYVALALGWPLASLLTVAVIAGLAAGALNPILTAVELERVPERLRSRVLAASMAIAFGGIPLGGIIGGWLVDAFGLTAALLACGAAYLIATLAPLTKTWADMDRRIPLDSDAQVQSAR
jgi:predicted MFS family arabinose efflux permease